MVGVEALAFQGWLRNDIRPGPFGPFTERLLYHLAGNAMNSFVLCDLLAGVFMFCDWDTCLEAYGAWSSPAGDHLGVADGMEPGAEPPAELHADAADSVCSDDMMVSDLVG